MTNAVRKRKRRKTVEQRFDDWWARTFGRSGLEIVKTEEDFKAYVRCGYFNGWDARTRTKR